MSVAGRPPSTRLPRRRLLGAALALSVTAAAVGLGGVAAADPGRPAVPAVFISQTIAGDSTTTLRTAVQSRLANAGQGGVTIQSVGSAAAVTYNAVGYRNADDHLYGIVLSGTGAYQLVKIDTGGAATLLGSITGLPSSGSYVSGSFGAGADADVLYVRDLTAGGLLYAIDVTTRAVIRTVTLSASFVIADFAWKSGYLWGVELSGSTRTLVRIDPVTGTATRIPVDALFPAGDSSYYGAAWVYGNGNLAYSSNGSGSITQLKITDPTGALPGVSRVSTIAGPSTSSNDGATSPADPADLQLSIQQPTAVAPSTAITWRITATNDGPGGSSGGTFSFAVPAGVTGVQLPTGCTSSSGTVQCVTGQLADGASDDYDFTAVSPASATVSASSTVTVVGNEADPGTDTAVLVVSVLPRALTTSGVGTAVQTISAGVPSGGSLTLLDGSTAVSTLAVTGKGSYAVSGTSLTFTPVLGWQGTAPAASFRITAAGETGTGSYTATVTPPTAPAAGPHTSTGVGTAQQQTTVTTRPAGGALTLLDGSTPVTTLTVAARGTYRLDAATATITFDPVLGYTGTATAVSYRVTDAYAQSATSTYTPTVTAPAGPVAAPFTSTGVGTAAQSPTTAVPVPTGGSVSLRQGGVDVTGITVAGQGSYTLSSAGVLTFTPVSGFASTATAAGYRVTDAYGQVATSTYTPTVTAPSGPAATPFTSSGVGTAEQSVTLPRPTGGSVTLLDGSTAVTTLATAAGTYALDPATGIATFDPVLGYAGTATAVSYRVTDAYGQPATSSYTPTVLAPAGPTAPDRTSTGVGTAPQSTTVAVPASGALVLLDGASAVTALTVPGQGRYAVTGGGLSFVPEFGFAGQATAVAYRLTDAYGQHADGHCTPTVLAPAGPAAAAVTTTGTGTADQRTTLVVPPGGSVTLLSAGTPATEVSDSGQGDYVLTPATGDLVFTPVLGFVGRAHGVSYRVADAYGQTATATHVPTVLAPTAPAPAAMWSTGAGGQAQQPGSTIVVPAGGRIALLDATGAAVDVVTIAGQGSYRLDAATGLLTFRPLAGFAGAATPVSYEVTDAYGQSATADYAATVDGTGTVDSAGTAVAGLAYTGTDVLRPGLLALGLLAAGAAALAVGRRRPRS